MNEIQDYAPPLQAIDQILELDDQGIHTAKAVSGNEPFFPGHYPDHPIFPGVFVLEAAHQAAGHYVARRIEGPLRARLVHLQSIRFLSPLSPGDRLEVICRCTSSPGERQLTVDADCRRGQDTPVARIRLQYALERL